MAEGWARHLKGTLIDAYSAGIEPHGMNARAIQVMREAGVDISTHHSKHVDELRDVPFDYVVTVCGHANETCPIFPGQAKIIHVGFDDPPALAKNAATEEEALAHYRRVRDEIRAFIETLPDALARTKQSAPRDKTKTGVLVMCVGNSCRSQMAEGFLRSLGGDLLDVHSAGLDPNDSLDPLAIQVMQEVGIDISRGWPKSVRAYLGRGWFKYTIVVCRETEARCPRVFIGATHHLFWPFQDPAAVEGSTAQRLQVFREVRDQIREKVEAWVQSLRGAPVMA